MGSPVPIDDGVVERLFPPIPSPSVVETVSGDRTGGTRTGEITAEMIYMRSGLSTTSTTIFMQQGYRLMSWTSTVMTR
jgi:anaerobic C4-dicarboxylate transporter